MQANTRVQALMSRRDMPPDHGSQRCRGSCLSLDMLPLRSCQELDLGTEPCCRVGSFGTGDGIYTVLLIAVRAPVVHELFVGLQVLTLSYYQLLFYRNVFIS